MWDWADPKAYLHDAISSDDAIPPSMQRPGYGALRPARITCPLWIRRATASQVKLTVRDPKTPSEARTPPAESSPYWGEESIWTSQANAHSFAIDGQNRLWVAARIRPNQTATFCRQGRVIRRRSRFRSTSGRQMRLCDPKTKQVTTVDTFFGTHHLNATTTTRCVRNGGPVVGWFNTRIYNETKDEARHRAGPCSSSTRMATANETRMSSQTSRSTRPKTSE
jgi:hypothetical protein